MTNEEAAKALIKEMQGMPLDEPQTLNEGAERVIEGLEKISLRRKLTDDEIGIASYAFHAGAGVVMACACFPNGKPPPEVFEKNMEKLHRLFLEYQEFIRRIIAMNARHN